MDTGAFHGRSLPCAFLKIRRGPHSHASTNSGKPSPSRSLHTAPLTRPTLSNVLLFSWSSTHFPPSFRYTRELAGSGYRPAITRPPTYKSQSPSPSKSPSANGPTLDSAPATAPSTVPFAKSYSLTLPPAGHPSP